MLSNSPNVKVVHAIELNTTIYIYEESKRLNYLWHFQVYLPQDMSNICVYTLYTAGCVPKYAPNVGPRVHKNRWLVTRSYALLVGHISCGRPVYLEMLWHILWQASIPRNVVSIYIYTHNISRYDIYIPATEHVLTLLGMISNITCDVIWPLWPFVSKVGEMRVGWTWVGKQVLCYITGCDMYTHS